MKLNYLEIHLNIEFTLSCELPLEYPDVVPTLSLEVEKGVSQSQLQELQNTLELQVRFIGVVMCEFL